MRLNTNMNALIASRNLNINTNKINQSISKISSGLKINKAGDNAAGLSISEKMRSQIRGLEQAQNNVQDGVSLIQVADGGIDEIQKIIIRCRELAVKAASGTYQDEDRELMQAELKGITSELERISNDTEFNSIPVLSGKYFEQVDITGNTLKDYVSHITSTGGTSEIYTYNGRDYASGVVDFSNINSTADAEKLVGLGFNYTCCSCSKAYSIKFVNVSPDTSRLNNVNPVMEVDISGLSTGKEIVDAIIKTAYGEDGYKYNPDDGYPFTGVDKDKFDVTSYNKNLPASATSFVKHFSKLVGNGPVLNVYDGRSYMAGSKWPSDSKLGRFEVGVFGESTTVEKTMSVLNLQVGYSEEDLLKLELPIVTLKTMKLIDPDVSISTQKNSEDAIQRFEDALMIVTKERTRVGAFQNRLEHIASNLGVSTENIQSSESRIRDVDLAKEVTVQAKYSILAQSSQAMLAQANKMNESILNLITKWN